MTKVQLKKDIDREVRGMRSRIADIVKNRIADQIIDDLGDETGELMGKLTVNFVDVAGPVFSDTLSHNLDVLN